LFLLVSAAAAQESTRQQAIRSKSNLVMMNE
jgi:hypothetical protein